jgi:hypothetical protein
LNEPDVTATSDRLSVLPRLPRDTGGPVFAEPWQAQAFALAHGKLVDLRRRAPGRGA